MLPLLSFWKLLSSGLLLCLTLCLLGMPTWALSATCPTLALEMKAVAPRVWLKPADPHAASGWREPTVVWVNNHDIWVLDPGPHRCAGLALRAWLARHWPDLPQRLINSHAHPENVLANAAWPLGTPIYALAETKTEMAWRCPDCLATLRRTLGEAWTQGTEIILPNRVLQAGQILHLGGLPWEVMAHPQAHTESHLSLWQPTQRIWIPVGLVAWDGLPDGTRSHAKAWQAALQDMAHRQPQYIWGAADTRLSLHRWLDTRWYWQTVMQHLQDVQAQGQSVLEALPRLSYPPHLSTPDLSPERATARHQQNLLREWQYLENEDF
ncbi:MAG: hypothetical protein RLZZ612_1103 [Pseudomonadota bacterium]|jgi:glyoxylase-like metal-dependent hydrolase (beta-lactamase superfamily II)